MKLRIGSDKKAPTKMEEDTTKVEEDIYADMNDEELSELQNEVYEQEFQNDTIAEILMNWGFQPSYITKFRDEFPTKNVIYHDQLTKQFFEWYLDRAPVELLEEIDLPEEYESFTVMLNKKYDEKKKIKKLSPYKQIVEKAKKEGRLIVLETTLEEIMYELLLQEKCDGNKKELDELIGEQIRTTESDTHHALINLINAFNLQEKLKDYSEEPEEEEEDLLEQDAILACHFLYDFMVEHMKFKEKPPDKKIKELKEIEGWLTENE